MVIEPHALIFKIDFIGSDYQEGYLEWSLGGRHLTFHHTSASHIPCISIPITLKSFEKQVH